MTSNIGAELIQKGTAIGFTSRADEDKVQKQSYERMKEKLLAEAKKVFRPEFLNRIDGMVVFHPLNKEHIRNIVNLMLKVTVEQLAEKDVKLEVTEAAKDLIGEKGFDEVFGARPLQRTIQDMISDRLSEDLLRGKFRSGDTIVVDAVDGEIVVNSPAVGALAGEEDT
jgi:ATP-dependent Clp protease ATP-binding subunit ClpC